MTDATKIDTSDATAPAASPTLTPAAAHLAHGGIAHEARAAIMVWRREMIRFRNDRARMFAMLLLALLFLGAFMLTSIGVLLSSRIKQIQAAMPASQLIIMPMMFLSGALFPIAHLPGWLAVLTKLNPLTYVVQPMRTAIFDQIDVP